MFDLVTVGHLAIDRIFSPKIVAPRPTLGGPPTYVSLSARRLGAEVSVVSKVGGDFPDEYVTWLCASGVDVSGLERVEGALTTRFILRYEDDWGRKLQAVSRAPSIGPEDIPPNLQAKAGHVAPIVGEVPPETVGKLRKMVGVLSLDPQGFVRQIGKEGNVGLRRWANVQVLRQIDVYKSSVDEIRMVTGLKNLRSAMRKVSDYGVPIVMVTKGVEGSTLLQEGRFYDVPACKPRVILDPTGAGDAFIGAFLAEYVQGKDPIWCACVGSAAASFLLEGVGPAVFGSKEEVYARASGIKDFVRENLSNDSS